MAVRGLAALPVEVAPLFSGAMLLIDAIREHGISDPFWTFGGEPDQTRSPSRRRTFEDMRLNF